MAHTTYLHVLQAWALASSGALTVLPAGQMLERFLGLLSLQ